jgi:hypothetical protein
MLYEANSPETPVRSSRVGIGKIAIIRKTTPNAAIPTASKRSHRDVDSAKGFAIFIRVTL